MAIKCFSCSKELTLASDGRIGFRDECAHCRADLHTCKNCEFYDGTSYNECRETAADRVKEKDRANYCEYFSLKKDGASGVSKKDAMLAAAEALFKKKD